MPEFTTDDGARIYFEMEGDAGGKPVLLFVHGWCSNLRHWDPQAEYFSRDYRVLRLDRRGYGRSPAPANYSFDFGREATDIAQLASSLGISEAVVVGHAGGIPTAIGLAAVYPNLVRALVCEDGTPQEPDPRQKTMLAPILQQLNGPDYQSGMKNVYPGFFHPNTDPKRVAAVASEAAETSPQVAVAFITSMPAIDTDTLARTLRMPVLFVMAEQSLSSTTPEELQQTVKQAQFVKIPDTGHFVHLDAPESFNLELERFLRTVA